VIPAVETRSTGANVGRCFAYTGLMDLSLTAPIWVLYLRDERGFSLTEITLLEVPLFLLIVCAEVPSGALADRYGRRLALLTASAFLTFSMLVYAVATSWALLLVSNLAFGLAHAMRSGADVALLHDGLERAGRIAEFPRISGRFWALRSGAMLTGYLLGDPSRRTRAPPSRSRRARFSMPARSSSPTASESPRVRPPSHVHRSLTRWRRGSARPVTHPRCAGSSSSPVCSARAPPGRCYFSSSRGWTHTASPPPSSASGRRRRSQPKRSRRWPR
jgi:hypothetical protein